jgi:hypothetical protein
MTSYDICIRFLGHHTVDPRNLDLFALGTLAALQRLLATSPWKFSRFSWQAPLRSTALTTLRQRLARAVEGLAGSDAEQGMEVEPMQVG